MTEILDILSKFQVLGGVLVGALGWLGNQVLARKQERRVWRLQRLDAQIRDFYGPLFAELTAHEAARDALFARFMPDFESGVRDRGDPFQSDVEREGWRQFVRDVLMPMNLRVEKILLSETNLLDGTTYPQSYCDFLTQLGSYKVLIARWDAGDLSQQLPVTGWPEQFLPDVSDALRRAQVEQNRLRSSLGLW